MAKIIVHAGDFGKGQSSIGFASMSLRTEKHPIMGETIPFTELETVEIASEDNVKKIGGTLGWGIAGAALFGPAGLLAGLLLGGRKKQVTFVVKFKDGRKLLATTDAKTYAMLQIRDEV